jgi:hypothetical protein
VLLDRVNAVKNRLLSVLDRTSAVELIVGPQGEVYERGVRASTVGSKGQGINHIQAATYWLNHFPSPARHCVWGNGVLRRRQRNLEQ